MSWKRTFGLDPIEFIVYWVVSMMIMVGLVEMSGEDGFVPLVLGVSGVAYVFLRRRILRELKDAPSETRDAVLARLQDEQASSADFFERRINELEERLDFTERLLTEQRDRQLAQGQPSSHDRG